MFSRYIKEGMPESEISIKRKASQGSVINVKMMAPARPAREFSPGDLSRQMQWYKNRTSAKAARVGRTWIVHERRQKKRTFFKVLVARKAD